MIEAIVCLSILNVFQLIFWSYQNHRLIDKVMSKNYAEYVQAKTQEKLPLRVEIPKDNEDSDEDILKELNGMLPT